MSVKDYLSYTADVVSIVAFAYGIAYGISRRTKSVTGFKINILVSRVLKTGIIIFISGIIYKISESLVITVVQDYPNASIEKVTYISFVIVVSLFVFWLLIPIIWTSSFVYAIEFINLFLPKSNKINTTRFRNEIIFSIDKGKYGKNNFLDVTEKLRQMVKNNSLEITASNQLAGDPDPGIVKDLIVEYTINGISKTATLKEGEKKIIPD